MSSELPAVPLLPGVRDNNNNNARIYIAPFPWAQWRFTIIVVLKNKKWIFQCQWVQPYRPEHPQENWRPVYMKQINYFWQLRSFGKRNQQIYFAVSATRLWNSTPIEIRQLDSFASFYHLIILFFLFFFVFVFFYIKIESCFILNVYIF